MMLNDLMPSTQPENIIIYQQILHLHLEID